jgi:hypothetical protein
MTAVRELRRCVRDLGGFKALRMVPWLWDLPQRAFGFAGPPAAA